nr:MAG TPA: hypothetical protein [Bacteriophage sp.]
MKCNKPGEYPGNKKHYKRTYVRKKKPRVLGG